MTNTYDTWQRVIDALEAHIDETHEQRDDEAVTTAKNLQKQLDRLQEEKDDIYQRTRGMSGCLARINAKVDAVTGADSCSTLEERNLEGRAAGAEGAVDLLIAQHGGVLKKLAEAQDYCIRQAAAIPPPAPKVSPKQISEVLLRLRDLATSGYTIAAIKALREITGLGLKEAKEAIDSMFPRDLPPKKDDDECGAGVPL